MGMLKSIRLKNFKCFEDSKDIKIAPLTVLCGVNSSGKTSILKSLLMLKQSYESNSEHNGLSINGKYVISGDYKSIVYQKNCDNVVEFSNNFVLSKPNIRYDNRSKSEITAFKNLTKLYKDYKLISDITLNITTGICSEGNDTRNNCIQYQDIILTVKYLNKNIIQTEIHSKLEQDKQYGFKLVKFPDANGEIIQDEIILKNAHCYFDGLKIVNIYANYIENKIEVSPILSNIYIIYRNISNNYKSINYLTPLRVNPQRVYVDESEITDVGIGGEYAAQMLKKYQNKSWYNLGFVPPDTDKTFKRNSTFKKYVNLWMKYCGFDEYSLELYGNNTLNMNIAGHNIMNVGFGISQSLPIIFSGLKMHSSDTLLLEQPEIHLHPKAQMCMADFLIEMSKKNKGVIVETHSDHIINRIVRRIMEDETGILKSKVAIYFINKNTITGKSQIGETIEISKYKGIVNAPEEFFSQFASETEKIISVAFNNLKENHFKYED